MLERLAPAVFVLIWSTGWIVAKVVAVAGGDPLTFLVLRYVVAGVLIVAEDRRAQRLPARSGREVRAASLALPRVALYHVAGKWTSHLPPPPCHRPTPPPLPSSS